MAAAAALMLLLMALASASAADVPVSNVTPITIEEITGVPYLVDTAGTHVLDVYHPTEGGPWPIVMMIHGHTSYGEYLHDWASAVAEQGAVVFVPTWTAYFFPTIQEQRAEFQREGGQVACAARFARMVAGTYGGDPSNLTIFGHSAGANIGSMIAFGRPTIPKGCSARSGSAVPENLVVFEGDFLLMGDRFWNDLLMADPGVMEDVTPWQYLRKAFPFPTRLFVSDVSRRSFAREKVGDPWAPDSWLALRDPTGVLRQGLQALGAFDDGWIDWWEVHGLLQARLTATGSVASLDEFPNSTHNRLSAEGLQMLVDAILQRT